MKRSAKTEYACLAMIQLASRFPSGQPVRIREIAEEHGIPSRFLVQILLQLKGAGLVTSVRGAAGGYRLARPPAEISLGDVVSVIEGPPGVTPTASDPSGSVRVLLETFQQIADRQREILAATSLEHLADRVRQQQSPMYYI